MTDKKTADIFAIIRHRIPTDGDGVTTLVGLKGCPLACKYCLNPQCGTAKSERLTADELYEKVRIDDLYFIATGGGITFGGGEPLLGDGKILGGLGVSGGTAEEDTALGEYGKTYFETKLR